MSEHRKAEIRISLKGNLSSNNLPEKQGKIIELYPVKLWKDGYMPGNKHLYAPRPPLKDHSIWWDSCCLYRVRVDGRWLSVKSHKYSFYSMSEVLDLIEKELRR